MGQQVVGSVPVCLAQAQIAIAGQATLAVVVAFAQVGHWKVGQQVVGSIPPCTGVAPLGQAIAMAGQATGLLGSHFDGAGAHWPVQVWPLQFPFASQVQLGSLAGQAQALPVDEPPVLPGAPPVLGGVLPAPVPPVVVPAEPQPQPLQVMLQAWPLGQSESALQPLWTFGTQLP